MAIFELYSKRRKKERGELPDIYIYNEIPKDLRIQILHIIYDAFGHATYQNKVIDTYKYVRDILCREYGVFSLPSHYHNNNAKEELSHFFLVTSNYENAMDVIEISFRVIDRIIRNDSTYNYGSDVKITPESAITELNDRFKEHGVGYTYESGIIIRVDSNYIHNEVTKPVISLLWNKKFSGPNDEYLSAHEHYRHGNNKECLTDCLKAFESTMKVICKEKNWTFDPAKDTASKLIQICFTNNLVPSFMQTHIAALKTVLESGVPTVRNKLSGHGQGAVPKEVDNEVARYALNLTGANIIFLVEQSGIG